MAKFLRTFWCLDCSKQATLEEISEGLTLIECTCGAVEVWGDDNDQELEMFEVHDQKMAEC
jgi:hypothetical protein